MVAVCVYGKDDKPNSARQQGSEFDDNCGHHSRGKPSREHGNEDQVSHYLRCCVYMRGYIRLPKDP